MRLIHGMNPVEFDIMVAGRYGMKTHDAQSRGKPFELTLSQFRMLYKAKYCAYTGVALSYRRNSDGSMPANYATLERVDNTKGYIPGNVVIVTNEANKAKSVFETKCGDIDLLAAVRMFTKIGEHLNKAA